MDAKPPAPWAQLKPRALTAALAARPGLTFGLLLTLFVGLRVLQALGRTTPPVDPEAGFTLAAAWELLHHRVWPPSFYQITPWEGGSLVTVLLAVPACLLFGPCLFALQATAILIAAATFCGLYLLCRECLGQRAAVLACLLYTLAPDPVASHNLVAHGYHPDAVALQLPFLWLLLSAMRRGQRPRRLLAAGLLGGLSIYFAFISAVSVLAGLLAWGWALRPAARPALQAPRPHLAAALLGGLCLGLGPLLFSALVLGSNPLLTYDGSVLSYLLPVRSLPAWASTARPLTWEVLFFNHPGPDRSFAASLLGIGFWSAALAALLYPLARALLGRLRPSPVPAALQPLDLLLLLYTALSLWTLLGSGHVIRGAHLVPLLVLLLPVLAGRAVEAWRWPLTRPLALLLCAPWALAGLQANRLPLPPRTWPALLLDGRNYALFLRAPRVWGGPRRFPALQPAMADLALALPAHQLAADPHPMSSPLQGPLQGLLSPEDLPGSLERYLGQAPPSASALRQRLAGFALGRLYDEGRLGDPQLIALLQRTARPQVRAVGRGLALWLGTTGWAPWHGRQGCPVTRLLTGPSRDRLPPEAAQGLAHGLGQAEFRRVLTRAEPGGPLLRFADAPALQESYAEGLGLGLASWSIRQVPAVTAHGLPRHLRGAFWRGVRQLDRPIPFRLPCLPQVDTPCLPADRAPSRQELGLPARVAPPGDTRQGLPPGHL